MNLHTVTVTVDEEGLRDKVIFTCAGDETSDCHVYPDAEQWTDDVVEDGYPHYAHEKCWLQDWFENDGYFYAGADGLDDGGEWGVPHTARSGPIEHEYDEWCVTWWWSE